MGRGAVVKRRRERCGAYAVGSVVCTCLFLAMDGLVLRLLSSLLAWSCMARLDRSVSLVVVVVFISVTCVRVRRSLIVALLLVTRCSYGVWCVSGVWCLCRIHPVRIPIQVDDRAAWDYYCIMFASGR